MAVLRQDLVPGPSLWPEMSFTQSSMRLARML